MTRVRLKEASQVTRDTSPFVIAEVAIPQKSPPFSGERLSPRTCSGSCFRCGSENARRLRENHHKEAREQESSKFLLVEQMKGSEMEEVLPEESYSNARPASILRIALSLLWPPNIHEVPWSKQHRRLDNRNLPASIRSDEGMLHISPMIRLVFDLPQRIRTIFPFLVPAVTCELLPLDDDLLLAHGFEVMQTK